MYTHYAHIASFYLDGFIVSSVFTSAFSSKESNTVFLPGVE